MGSPEATPVGVMPDGTQIWRIFHNGVDTHTIHTHLFHAQLINRLGQDGLNLGVDPIELGWKDTFRVNPLEITYLAMRPTVPTPDLLPFEAPDSVRLIDPTLPDGADLVPPPPAGWFTPAGVRIARIRNHVVNFGWEYVWHCHILAHEEMDMMHSLVFAVPPGAPTNFTHTVTGTAASPRVNLFWQDNSFKEIRFTVERATDANFTTGLRTFNRVNPDPAVPSQVTFTDTTVPRNGSFWYRVWAIGPVVGDTQTAGFPTESANTVSSTVAVQLGTSPVPAAPTSLLASAAAGPVVNLTWTDWATNETGFVVERCLGAGCGTALTVPPGINWIQIAAMGPRASRGLVNFVDSTVAIGGVYEYQVKAVIGTSSSAYTNIAAVTVPAIPFAPATFTASATKNTGLTTYTATLFWSLATLEPNPASFTIQRSTRANFTTGLSTMTVAGNLLSATQIVNPNTTYYFRIRANNSSASSTWRNATPFPVRTGP